MVLDATVWPAAGSSSSTVTRVAVAARPSSASRTVPAWTVTALDVPACTVTARAVLARAVPACVIAPRAPPVRTGVRRGTPSTQTRSSYRRGAGQSAPAKRMTAPARPPPETPLASAIDASPSDRVPPGRMDGAYTSTAARRNLTSAASQSCRWPAVGPSYTLASREPSPATLGCPSVSFEVSSWGAWRLSAHFSACR
jgi:hypothetical protein